MSTKQKVQKKRKSFFDFLRSDRPKKQQAERKRKRSSFWFFDNDRDDVNVIYGNDEPVRYTDFDNADPEPLPTIGMGNLTYAAPLQVPLYDASISKLPPVSGEAEFLRQALTDKRSPVRTAVPHRKAVLDFYRARAFTPVWISGGKLTPRADALLAQLKTAGNDGLVPEAYLPYGLSSFENMTEVAANLDSVAKSRFDIALTAAALKYAQHLNSGQFEPARLSLYNDIKVQSESPEGILRILGYTPFIAEYFAGLAPKHPAYPILKQELAALTASGDANKPPQFPTGRKLVKVGQQDERIPELRQRMQDLGLLDHGDTLISESELETLDKPLSNAIKAFQKANNLKVTGHLDLALVAKFNEDPTRNKRGKVIASMERIRWLPRDLGTRHVFVNQPAYLADLVENGKPIWSTKVIVGRPLTQTAAFHDEFETVVFNPSWGVPQSILVNEYLPKLRRDPGHFDKIGYKVTTENGQPIKSRSVNWGAYGNQLPFNVQQPPGPENALGEVKFLFPNEHAIYMHDTPTRKLFAETVRSFSHGCVRVENPRHFASVLLNWGADSVASRIESGQSSTVKIPQKTKVHLTYFAAWPDSEGKVQYHDDIYERDKTLIEAHERMILTASNQAQGRVADVTPLDGTIQQ